MKLAIINYSFYLIWYLLQIISDFIQCSIITTYHRTLIIALINILLLSNLNNFFLFYFFLNLIVLNRLLLIVLSYLTEELIENGLAVKLLVLLSLITVNLKICHVLVELIEPWLLHLLILSFILFLLFLLNNWWSPLNFSLILIRLRFT